MHANGIVLYGPVRSTSDLICLYRRTLHTSLGLWANSCQSTLQSTKMQGQDSINEETCCNSNPLLLNGQPVNFMDSIRYLGLTISADLSWSKHIKTSLPKQGNQLAYFSSSIANMLAPTIRKLYFTIVRPHLEYACKIYN